MKKTSSPFSPQRNGNDQVSMAYDSLHDRLKSREFIGDSLWLSKKMVDEGCTLVQTLQMMEERCKNCSVASPMFCVEQCETWKVKKELHETNRFLLKEDHRLKLLNAIKNRRRLAIINVLLKRYLSIDDLQRKLKECGFCHSENTVAEYLKPLLEAGLVKERGNRFGLTLYGRKVHDAVSRYGFKGCLSVHSGGYEEKVLRSLLDGAKTRNELLKVVSEKSLSRVVKRLRERNLITDDAPSDRVFYFRTKRALSLERISPTQKRICEAIPEDGVSARDLSASVGVSLRRTYKYLRNLRGKKLVFRRETPSRYELTTAGQAVAEFLNEIACIM